MEDQNAPATKSDLAALETRLEQKFDQFRAETNHQYDDLKETIRDAQTEVLKAFYSFAESNRQRVAQLEGNQGALITRIGTLEDRMLELERKINFPNQPPQ